MVNSLLRWPRVLLSVVGSLAVLYAVVCFLAFLGQRKLIYPAPEQAREPAAIGARLERFVAADASLGYALYAPAAPGQTTIVHFHGNGEDLAQVAGLVDLLHAQGLGVFAVEYPGYGLAQAGTPSETTLFSVAAAALEHLRTELGVPRESIVLEGQSLGTGVATEMAHRGLGARLILISPYTSMVDMARLVMPILPVRVLLRDRYDTERIAPDLTLPTLVIHGTLDDVIPVRMGRRIAGLIPRAEFLAVPAGHHNDLFEVAGDALLARIVQFARGTR